MEKVNRVEIVKDIIGKIQSKWTELQKDFYICYSVKELAYKISYELLEQYYEECNNAIFCKKIKDKFKIAIYFEQNIYFIFDIYWATGMFGDSGLHISNGQIYGELPKGYEDIEYVLEDNEEE